MVAEFIRGPMVWVAFGVFFAGLLLEGWRFFRLSKPVERPLPPSGSAPSRKRPPFVARMELLAESWWLRLRRSHFAAHPFMFAVTLVFHVLLFVVPIFLLAHNQLFKQAWGIALPSLPEALADALTFIVLACGAVFVFRRLFLKRVRSITGPIDWLMLAITLTPFVSGFLAYRQVGDYRTVVTVHIASGELMLMAIPFTKLGHMIFFFLYRLFLGGEHAFVRGRRAW